MITTRSRAKLQTARPSAFARRLSHYRRFRGGFQIDLQRFVEDAQAEFLGVRGDLENAFLAKFGPAVDSIAKKRGLLFVLNQDSGVLAWADPTLDITTDVVTIVNQP
jgi:Skp family chaperone for outer membrane proteins